MELDAEFLEMDLRCWLMAGIAIALTRQVPEEDHNETRTT